MRRNEVGKGRPSGWQAIFSYCGIAKPVLSTRGPFLNVNDLT